MSDLTERLRDVLADATPGPWKWVEDGESMWLEGEDDVDVLVGDEDRWVHVSQADGELIAVAPVLLARAADRIERLEAQKAEPDRNLLHCIDHLSHDVDEGWRMNWASNDDLRAILEYLDLVIAKEGA